MTTFGWVFMLTSVTGVVTLITYCFYRVLTSPGAENKMHAPLDIDTGDLDT